MFQDPKEPLRLPRSPELFDLGHVRGTPGAVVALIDNGVDASELVMRHAFGFWGDLEPEDRLENERALENGGRIFSAYTLPDLARVWIITEADRSATTLLLPGEY
ncbi:hypothetical protein BH11ARM2_BH11ARM2_38460 [soil metagenome]